MSHCELVLAALRDGNWHSTANLYREIGQPLILHSRISDLRRKGYDVQGRSVPGKSGAQGYEYRLIQATEVRLPVDPIPSVPAAEQQLALAVAPSHYDI